MEKHTNTGLAHVVRVVISVDDQDGTRFAGRGCLWWQHSHGVYPHRVLLPSVHGLYLLKQTLDSMFTMKPEVWIFGKLLRFAEALLTCTNVPRGTWKLKTWPYTSPLRPFFDVLWRALLATLPGNCERE